MLAQNNEYLEEAANSIYQANAEEIVRQQCRAREDAERRERTLIRNYNLIKEELDAANNKLADANARIQELEDALAQSKR